MYRPIFAIFFVNKIVKIHHDLVDKQSSLEALEQLQSDTIELMDVKPLDSFCPATEDEIKRIIISSSNATCDSDPIPTHIVKQCIEICFDSYHQYCEQLSTKRCFS